MKILITGGSGYLGNVLVNKLIQSDNEYRNNLRYNVEEKTDDFNYVCHTLKAEKIFVYDNLMYKQVPLHEHFYKENFEFVHGDVRDQKKLYQYIKEADVIIPLAAIVGFPACEKEINLAEDVNYKQIKFIAENTSKEQKIIFPNTNSMYGTSTEIVTETSPMKPLSKYATTKCDAEKALLDNGNAIILRLATVFGVSARMRLDLLVNDFVYRAMTDRYIVLFEHLFKRNYINIQDVALTFIYMINSYEKYVGEIFNVGLSNANLNKLELAMKIKEHIPDFVIKTDEFASDPDKRNYIVSNEKLESTGWKAYYSLNDGIKELMKAYKIIIPSNKLYTNL